MTNHKIKGMANHKNKTLGIVKKQASEIIWNCLEANEWRAR